MHDMKPLIDLSYTYDKDKLLEIASQAKLDARPHKDSRYPGEFKHWLISHCHDPYLDEICHDLNVKAKPRFYWLEPNASVPYHIDNNTECSVNIILTEGPAPITIDEVEYFYTCALLNTTIRHAVFNNDQERILLKFSIFDETFEEVVEKINFKK